MFAAMLVLLASFLAADDGRAVVNGGYEQRAEGWRKPWAREGEIRLDFDERQPLSGKVSARISAASKGDWSFQQDKVLPVRPGEVFELSALAQVEGEGNAGISVVLRDSSEKVLDWTFGEALARASSRPQRLKSKFVIPPKAASIIVRWVGHGPVVARLDDVELKLAGDIDSMRAPNLPKEAALSNAALQVVFHTDDGRLTVTDRRNGRRWEQLPSNAPPLVLAAEVNDGAIVARLLDTTVFLEMKLTIRCAKDAPELSLKLDSRGVMSQAVSYPAGWRSPEGGLLIMPVNEGISYPVDDRSLPEMHYILYGGHGLCMGWYGVCLGTRGDGAGVMTVVEDTDDASVRVVRRDDRLHCRPYWEPQKGEFGYPRRMRFVFFDRGGYVAMAKRYREHAREIGLLKTLAEKRRENPNVDMLVGAVNVWCWDRDAVEIAKQMLAEGIDRILWSNRGTPEVLEQLNRMNVLTSRYDIYQDVMNPAEFPRLRHIHQDWTTEAWPDDLMIDRNGDWIRGWAVRDRDGNWLNCGVTCDARAVEYAQKRIPAELKTHPYRCRFIDTTTASPWRECYHPKHPVTRTESRQWKMRLLEYVSKDCGLVCGSETGHEAAVPYVHYFEGMLSLGPYRVPDAGRNMQQILDEAPERVAVFQTGHHYRLPLWELVYHDCVIAQWYWGDYNNKIPSLWRRRDLFNALYGTPPMFFFSKGFWRENRQRFAESYRTAAPVARRTGYSEMLSHAWLTDDRAVQQTRFADGTVVTVNFGDRPHALPDGSTLAPLSLKVEPPL